MSRRHPTGSWRYLWLVVPHLALLATWKLAENLAATLIFFAAALAVLVWARSWRPVPSLHVFLLVSVALRVLVLPLPPTLSDDVLRYVWDGRVAGAGFNPYVLPPDAPELAHLRNDLWQELPHKDVATVYPPLAMTLFSIAAASPWPILFWKLLLTAADLVACAFLYRLASLADGDAGRAIWYAWNPLVTLEIAGMGHVDGLGVCAVVVAVWALAAGRRAPVAAIAAAASVLAKLVPVLCYPVWWRRVRRRWLFAGVTALGLGASLAPVAIASGGIPSGYVRFGRSWEFNGPLYEPLWRAFEVVDSRARIESVLERVKEKTGRHEFWNLLFPFNYPRMHARVFLGGLLLLFLARAWRRNGLVPSTGGIFEALVLCSATVYPWYLLWLLPFAALEERPAWLVLCCLAFFSYLPQFTEVPLMPWVFAACWGPYALMRGLEGRWSSA